jgi:orotidine-5'-phosphate decarboxylase
VFILCRTSNIGAADFQQLRYHSPEGETYNLFELVALKAREWDIHHNIGLVVGATQPEALKIVRGLCPEMPLLIPGIGAQGGDLASAVCYGVDAEGKKAIISCSRQILYASRGKDFPSDARHEALKIRNQINQYLSHKEE